METNPLIDEREELHHHRALAHKAFDGLWKTKHIRRPTAYVWLQLKMDKTPDQCHIALFTKSECLKVVQHVEEFTT